MTQEEKQLLLKDLCARLPYRVKCSVTKKGVVRKNGINMPVNKVCDVTVKETLNTDIVNDFINDNVVLKPYLRPMSSMADDERFELWKKTMQLALQSSLGLSEFVPNTVTPAAFEIDYYNTHHLDYRGLIEKGLALEAPEGMYKNE